MERENSKRENRFITVKESVVRKTKKKKDTHTYA